MLCLSRKEGEGIVIGDGVQVVVYDIVRGRCRLAIEAAADIPIHRIEVDRRGDEAFSSDPEQALRDFFARGCGRLVQRAAERFPIPGIPSDDTRRFVRRPGSLIATPIGDAS